MRQTDRHGWTYLGQDLEVTPGPAGTYFVLLSKSVTNDVPYTFRLVPGNHAPVLGAIGNKTVGEQTALSFTATATDFEQPNDQLSFSLDPGAPAGATIVTNTGAFAWTPTEVQGPGMYTCTVRVADDGLPSLDDSETIMITVNEINRAPSIFVPANQTINEMTLLTVTNRATDPDIPVNALSFSVLSAPAGVSINTNSGVLTWTSTEAQGPATNTITVVVTDYNPDAVNEKHLSATGSFQVVVREINVAPVLTVPTNRAMDELTTLTVTNTATDPDIPANGLTFGLVAGPAGMTLNTNTGVMVWTPTEAQVPSTNTITVMVTDDNPWAANAQHLSATQSFQVVVREINVAPTIRIVSPTNAARLTPLTDVVISTAAGDSDGNLARVEFYAGINKLGEVLTPPYEFVWTHVWPGRYTLTAHARDLANATATSAPISVVVLPMWTNVQKQASMVGFTLIGEVGTYLIVEKSADLKQWAPVATNPVGTDGRLQWTVIPSPETRNEIFRARAP